MKNSIISSLLLFVVLGLTSFGEVYQGKLTEEGYGKFKMLDKESQIEFLIYQSKKETTYSPEDWRPQLGDTISVDCYVKDKRFGNDASMLVAAMIKLVEPGPQSLTIESPVKVKLLEMGRRKVLVKFEDSKKSMRFDKARKLDYDPIGWVPNSGDEIFIHFIKKESRFNYNMAYVITKIEKP